MSRADIADKKHREGYNCCQAVACAFSDVLEIDEALLYKLCEGFGAGMGTAKGVCGAMSGAAIIAGLVNSDGDINHPGQTKAASTKLAGQMQRTFIERAGALICKDIKTGNNGGPYTSCTDCIRAATEIIEEVMGL